MWENVGLEKFIPKNYVQKKHDRKYPKNGYFGVWFLENSKKFNKINSNSHFS